MKKLMVCAVMAMALGFVANGYAKQVTFDTSRLPNAEVKIIGVEKTFTIPARGRKQQTFDLEKKTEKSKFLRKTKFEGYVKDIEVESLNLKASDESVKGLIEYINGVIGEFDHPTFIISQPKGSTGLSVSLASKQVIFKFKKDIRDKDLKPPIQVKIELSNGENILRDKSQTDEISLNLMGSKISRFTLTVTDDRSPEDASSAQINRINRWISDEYEFTNRDRYIRQEPLIINYNYTFKLSFQHDRLKQTIAK